MRRKLFLSVLSIFFSISFVSSIGCNNQSSVSEKRLKEIYDLQEKCGKSCEQYVRKNYGEGVIGGKSLSYHYTNHYNKKMNKCFILLTLSGVGTYQKIIIDIHEQKTYGLYSGKEICSVSDKECKSLMEWDLLVKPYMEE